MKQHDGGFRRRLHAVVNHAELPYGYTLASGTGGAVVATVHGRFDTLQALLFLAGAGTGFALIALISAGAPPAGPPAAARIASLWNVGAATCAVAAGSIAAHDLHGPGAYFATGLIITVVYFAGAAARSSPPVGRRGRPASDPPPSSVPPRSDSGEHTS